MVTAELLSVDAIRRALHARTVGCHLYLLGELDSTNARLRALAHQGAPEGTVVLAEGQTAGRGRRGQPWFSPSGVNLHVSALFRPTLPPRELGVFSFIASVAATDAIRTLGLHPTIKWPNDVLVEGRKVGGVLAEAGVRGDQVDDVVLGLGLNVNVESAVLRAALGPAGAFATSLAAVTGREIDRNALAAAYLDALDHWYARWRQEGSAPLVRAWSDRDVLVGRRIEARGRQGTVEGRVMGVSAGGGLVVQTALGATRTLVDEEIRVAE
jgi:BirA family biotin operon repressor/biotin-[acetyl-CoA-carboxylase] ligase